MTNPMINRVQAGVPSGGQFATTTHTESGISLGSAHTPIYARPADETVFYRSRGEYEPTERVSVGDLLKPSRNGWDTRFEETSGHIVATKDESTFTFQPLPITPCEVTALKLAMRRSGTLPAMATPIAQVMTSGIINGRI